MTRKTQAPHQSANEEPPKTKELTDQKPVPHQKTPQKPENKRPQKTLPRLTGGLPYLGHGLAFGRNPIALMTQGREQFGDAFSFPLLGQEMAVFTGPKANEAFFKAPDDQFSAKEAYQFMVPIFGKGIAYDVSAERMGEQLSFVFPALRDERMQRYAEIMAEETQKYLSSWGDRGEVDLLTAMNELTTFIAGRCLIGEEFANHLTTEFAELYHDLEGGINLLAFYWPNLPLPSFRRRDKARVRMGELISQVITDRRSKGTEGEDFLQALMNARYADGSALSDDNITGLLLTLLFAGQHTSAVLAAWSGLLLFQHPQYLPDLLQEQHTICDHTPHINWQSLKQMDRLSNAIREAERLRPPLVMLMRKVLRDFEYDGYHVPAGTMAMISPAVSHRVGDVFQDPDRYDPDRYGPGREEHLTSRYALIGFGGGRHRCIDQSFTYQQVKMIWSCLLRQFDFERVGPIAEPNYATFVVGPQQPCRVRYRKKKKVEA